MVSILGLHVTGAQSSAVIVKNGQVVCGAAEERFTRQKRTRDFPSKSIRWCLKNLGLSGIEDLDAVAVSYNPVSNIKRLNMTGFTSWRRYDPEWFYIVPNNLMKLYASSDKLGEDVSSLALDIHSEKVKIFFVNHHIAHASEGYYQSPFYAKGQSAAILIIDEYGEFYSTTLAIGKPSSGIKIIKQIPFPHSLGVLYATFTEFLGFMPNSDEWKVMGAAALGNPEKFYKKISALIHWKDEEYFLDLSVFEFANMKFGGYFTGNLERYMGIKRRQTDEPLKQVHYDLAASVQKVYEDIFLRLIKELYRRTGVDNLVISGGCAMNSLANGKILTAESKHKFRNLYVSYAPADNGGGIGAALWMYHSYFRRQKQTSDTGIKISSPYLGPSYTDEEIKQILDKYQLGYHSFESDTTCCRHVARLIASGKIVGWFQGAMEFGERALGNRSILADPRCHDMKDKINKAVKYREGFRPFAPSVIYEKATDYFILPRRGIRIPYMEQVYIVKEEKRKIIPAVTHYDGTARIQTVEKDFNPKYYTLLKEFEKITDVPVLLNTSFNVQGEPIVCSPADAIKTFYSSGIDALVMGNFLIEKR